MSMNTARLQKAKQALFINGEWVQGDNHTMRSIDPADGSLVWEANSASNEQVDAAIQAARTAFPAWANRPLEERLSIIERFADEIKANTEKLANTISRETGKPLWETRTEVSAMIGKIAISTQAYHERTGEKTTPMPGATARLRHKPHGVVAVFGPYNFPGHLPNGHIVPALIAGNTVVLKPSEQAPATSDFVLQLWEQAGLPNGVLNMIQGERDAGIYLANHTELDGLFFTGSPQVGHILHQSFAGNPGKILALEMGGNNPLLVSQHTQNVDAVVHEIVQSAFLSAGQRCTCARRLLLPEGTHGDTILENLIKVTSLLNIDRYDAMEQPFMGPVVSAQAADGLMYNFNKLVSLGGTPLYTMRRGPEKSGFVTPGIVDMTHVLDALPDAEYFGPILTVIRFRSMEEAMKIANNTQFGLSAGILSDLESEYDWFFRHSRAGIINWNRQTTGASSAAPFGGTGASGNHRASAYYAADYCAYPVSSIEVSRLEVPDTLVPGLTLQV